MTSSATITIPVDLFRDTVLALLYETIEHGYIRFIDRGASLLETLDGLSAGQASQSLGPRSGTIAAKVNHTTYYIESIVDEAESGEPLELDWPGSWAVEEVDEAEWADLRARLMASWTRFREWLVANEEWEEQQVGDTLAVVAHTAYHLGEVRQALAVVDPNP